MIDDDANEKSNSKKNQDTSEAIRTSESGIIESVKLTTNREGYKMVKVKYRIVRIYFGDKFAYRHEQKDIIGMTYRQEGLPFTIKILF